MEFAGKILDDLWGVWKSMFKATWPVVVRFVSLALWVLSALIILPCVFVAGTLYPMWEKWGEDF